MDSNFRRLCTTAGGNLKHKQTFLTPQTPKENHSILWAVALGETLSTLWNAVYVKFSVTWAFLWIWHMFTLSTLFLCVKNLCVHLITSSHSVSPCITPLVAASMPTYSTLFCKSKWGNRKWVLAFTWAHSVRRLNLQNLTYLFKTGYLWTFPSFISSDWGLWEEAKVIKQIRIYYIRIYYLKVEMLRIGECVMSVSCW